MALSDDRTGLGIKIIGVQLLLSPKVTSTFRLNPAITPSSSAGKTPSSWCGPAGRAGSY